MVMELAGQGRPEAGSLAFSRWLMAVILATPVVYGGAVTISAWRAVRRYLSIHNAVAATHSDITQA